MIFNDNERSKLTRPERDFVIRVRNTIDGGGRVPTKEYARYRRLWRLMGGR